MQVAELSSEATGISPYLKEQRDIFDLGLRKELGEPKNSLQRAMGYSLFLASKRLRPLFCLEVCRAWTGSSTEAFLPAAALELVHTYSLIHDDLPAMDNDDLRRGQPTSHRVFGEARAILAGDALLTKAFEILTQSSDSRISAELRLAWVRELAQAAGDHGMVLGQDWDLASEGVGLEDLHLKKTGALFAASWVMGALAAGLSSELVEKHREMALRLGLAFQIQDDVLDVEGGEELGKPVGSDEKNQKKTFVSLMGLEKAKEEARRLLLEVKQGLAEMNFPFPNRLEEMATFVVERKS